MQPTKQDIEEALEDLKKAMLRSLEIKQQEVQIKIEANKAHHELLRAKDAVHALNTH